jgi:hypothetical protein
MIFSVYDRSAENIAGDVKEKGALEVIRILDAHHSEAAITKDDLKNPLMPEDKIMNPAYLAGQPQHFAIAGFIDFDGDGQSDLNRLLTLIHNNGGEVDVMVDENGKLTGAITPSTSLLVIGIHPDEKKLGEAASKSWNRILKDADDMKIGSMNVPEFLKYMGYQGRERSVPLGKDAADSPDAPFSKRPPRGADGGAF